MSLTGPAVPVAPVTAVGHGRFGNPARHEALVAHGYVPPTYLLAADDPSSTTGRGDWWDQHFIAAEHDEAGGFPQMPDDYTPSMTEGASLAGNRRTHRMKYTGAGVTLRMPSATSVKRYAAEVGSTFDVPISIRNNATGGTLAGWVRVTHTGPGSWSVTGLGFGNGDANAKVSEAVAAVLEARRPTRGLREVGDLLAKRRERIAGAGTTVEAVNSAWVGAVGYDERTGVLITQTSTGAVYGHRVRPETFESMRTASSAGKAFNQLVRGNPRVQVTKCAQCARVHASSVAHTCPPSAVRVPAPGVTTANARNRARAEHLAATVSGPHTAEQAANDTATHNG